MNPLPGQDSLVHWDLNSFPLGHCSCHGRLQGDEAKVAHCFTFTEHIINFRKTEGIVDSNQHTRVESTANGMTNLAVTVVIITVAIILGVNICIRLQEVRPSESIK